MLVQSMREIASLDPISSEPLIPKSSFVTISSPDQLLSPASSQNFIMTPISRPHFGHTRSKSSKVVWTNTDGFPVAADQFSSSWPIVSDSAYARTDLPRVSLGLLRIARTKTPVLALVSPMVSMGTFGEVGCSRMCLPADFCSLVSTLVYQCVQFAEKPTAKFGVNIG
jgi:hypothetical protein